MTSRLGHTILWTLALCLAWSTDVKAEQADAALDSLYGADLKRVAATPDARDDVELAGKLLEAARKATAQPDLLAALCEKAYRLAAKVPAGYQTAADALELASDTFPDKQAQFRDRLIALYQKLYTSASDPADRQSAGESLVSLYQDWADDKADAGDLSGALEQIRKAKMIASNIRSPIRDEVNARLMELTAREQLQKQATTLKARLKANEGDAAAREQLVHLLLVDMDSPAEAAKFVSPAVADEYLRTYVPLAAKPVDDLDEASRLGLAQWYRGLAEKAPATAQIDMYERARSYFAAYLQKHTTDDLAATKAKLSLDSIDAILVKLNSASDTSGWTELLQLVNPTKHCAGGEWVKQGQRLSVTATDMARATVPVLPDGSYKLRAKFTRTKGAGQVIVVLPVAKKSCALVLSASKGASGGLQMVDDKPCDSNVSTTRPCKLDNAKEYTLDIKVIARGKQQTITSTLNGQKSVQWQGQASDLSLGDWTDLMGPAAIALAATDGSITFASVKLRVLAGGAKVLGDKPAARPRPRYIPPRVPPRQPRPPRRGRGG